VKTIWYCLYWLAIFGVTLRVLLKIESNTRTPLRVHAKQDTETAASLWGGVGR
jgi:hypothetical protein